MKKQTALRLAQEQQQKQGGYYVDPNRERPLQPLAEQQFVPYGQCVHPAVAVNPVVNPGYPTGHVGIPAPNVGFPNQGYPIQNPPVAQFSPTGSYDSYGNPLGVASFVCTENRQLSPRNLQQHVLMRREVSFNQSESVLQGQVLKFLTLPHRSVCWVLYRFRM